MHCLWLCLWWSYKKTKKKSLKYSIMALDPKWTWWSSYNGFRLFFMPQYLGLKHRPVWLYTWWDSFTIYIRGIISKAPPNSITMYNIVPLILLISVEKIMVSHEKLCISNIAFEVQQKCFLIWLKFHLHHAIKLLSIKPYPYH